MEVAKANQGGNIRFVGLSRQKIREKNDEIHLIVSNHGTDLLVTAERS